VSENLYVVDQFYTGDFAQILIGVYTYEEILLVSDVLGLEMLAIYNTLLYFTIFLSIAFQMLCTLRIPPLEHFTDLIPA